MDILFLLRHRGCFYLTFVSSIPSQSSVPTVLPLTFSDRDHLHFRRAVHSLPPPQLLSLSPAGSERLSEVSSIRHPQPLHLPASSQSVQPFPLSISSPLSIRPRTPLHCGPSFLASSGFSPPDPAHVLSPLFSDAKIVRTDCRILSRSRAGPFLLSVPRRHPSSPRGLHSQSPRAVASDALRGRRVLSSPRCLFSDSSRI